MTFFALTLAYALMIPGALASGSRAGANSIELQTKGEAPVRIEANTRVAVNGVEIIPFNIRTQQDAAGDADKGLSVAIMLVTPNGQHKVRVHAGETVDFEGKHVLVERVEATFILVRVS